MSTKHKLIAIAMALATLQAGATQYWTDGVNSDEDPTIGHWKDYNKEFIIDDKGNAIFKEGEGGWANLCWAASASNMLDWWQESNDKLAVKTLPTDIWGTFMESFTDSGAEQNVGIHWWFNGELGPRDKPADPEFSHLNSGCTNGNYYNFSQQTIATYLTRYDISPDIRYLKDKLISCLQAGQSIGGGIFDTTGNLAHAITIWGIDYDDTTGKITQIHITDSDDSVAEIKGDKVESTPEGLRSYVVTEEKLTTAQGSEITALVINDYASGFTVYLDSFDALSRTPHAPVDTSLEQYLSTHNGKRSFTLLNSAAQIRLFDPMAPLYAATPGSATASLNLAAPEVVQLRKVTNKLMKGLELAELERLCSAVAGSSIPTLGKAFSDTMNRQLRTMRDRANASTGSIAPDKNYCVWVEADGNTYRLSSESAGTDAGYDLQSWGGTVGITSKFAEEVHAGIAFTALQGNFSANSYDHAKGDLDTYYFTTFATVNSGNWEHSFVATAAKADTTLSREVSYSHEKTGTFYSRNRGKSEGKGFGFMYETAYNIKCKESSLTFSPVLNVSATHSRLHGYTERGDALALAPGTTDMTLFTIGAGARLQGEFGENLFNRKAQFQCRAMLNGYLGDRRAETPMQFAASPARQTIRSAESGAIGLELGAGVALPLGNGSSAIYADAAAEFNSGYNSANFNLGYRFSF